MRSKKEGPKHGDKSLQHLRHKNTFQTLLFDPYQLSPEGSVVFHFCSLICSIWLKLQYCAKVMQANFNEFLGFSWLFEEISLQTKFPQPFRELSRHLLFYYPELSNHNSQWTLTSHEISRESSLFSIGSRELSKENSLWLLRVLIQTDRTYSNLIG